MNHSQWFFLSYITLFRTLIIGTQSYIKTELFRPLAVPAWQLVTVAREVYVV